MPGYTPVMLARKRPASGSVAAASPLAQAVEGRSPAEAAPTMIIPRGTEIRVDGHGQLSIRSPGNLVLQNSGSYGSLESLAGSIRIERDVEVEAVSVRCAEHCYVQGRLTAWSVAARSLQIEDSGRAYVVLQETERLEVGREARIVGNFSSERELFLLFSRFADQLRSLPLFERAARREGEAPTVERGDPPAPAGRSKAGVAALAPPSELPDPLLFALVLLERDAERGTYGPTSQRALAELVRLLRERDLGTLGETYRTLFARVVEPREDVRRARELVEEWQQGGRAASS
jgi:hypothetical protein